MYENRICIDAGIRDLLTGSLLAFVAKVWSACASFLLSILVARSLGVADAGIFFLAYTLLVVFSTIGRGGGDLATVRFVSECIEKDDIENKNSFYWWSLFRVLVLSLLLTFLIFFFSAFISDIFFKNEGGQKVIERVALSLIPFSLVIFHSYFFQANKNVLVSNFLLSGAVPSLLLVCAFVFSCRSVLTYFDCLIFVACILMMFLLIKSCKEYAPYRRISFNFKAKIERVLLSMFIVSTLSITNQWSSQIILGILSNSQSVAYFATAQRAAFLVSFVLVAVNSIAAPKFSALYSTNDIDGIGRMMRISSLIMIAFAMPILMLYIFCSEVVMGLFGETYRDANLVLIILSVGQMVNVATGSVGYLLQMTGYEKELRFNVLISTFLLVILNIVLIPKYEAIGAACATAFSVSVANLLSVRSVKKKLGINSLKFF